MDNNRVLKSNASFIESLREQTALLHKQVEQLPASAVLLDKDLSKKQYADYLRTMYSLMQDIEENVFPIVKDLIPDIEERRKIKLLKNDLAFLQTEIPGDEEKPLTQNRTMITPAFAMGILYVTEGSSLGGRIILKSIHSSLELTETDGASYFAGYKDDTGNLWKRFINSLTSYEKQNNASTEIIEGAKFAFTSIYNHMNKLTPQNEN